MAAGFTKAAGGINGLFENVDGPSLGNTIKAAVLGGTASVIGGGKFKNGAITGSFSYLFGSIARQASGPPGRALTGDEITEAQKVFGDKVDYTQVRVIDGKFVPFQNVPMSPDGNIYWPGDCGNLATCYGGAYAKTFIHEMTHVLQVQHGVNVLGQGFLLQAGRFLSFGTYNPYKFTYDPNRTFSSYNIEQQGAIAEQIYRGNLPNNIDY